MFEDARERHAALVARAVAAETERERVAAEEDAARRAEEERVWLQGRCVFGAGIDCGQGHAKSQS